MNILESTFVLNSDIWKSLKHVLSAFFLVIVLVNYFLQFKSLIFIGPFVFYQTHV